MGWALVGGLFFWSFGLYIDPVEAHFGWSRAEVSLGIAVAILAGGLAAPVVGRMTDRRGPRFVLFSGAVIGALGFGLLATTSALWQWYIYLGVVGVAMAMLIFIPLPVLAARWFERRRGAAVGILGVGISIGGLVIVPIVRVTIDALGWEGSLIVSAVAIPAYWLPVTFFIVRDRPPEGVRPDASAAHPATDTAARADLSLRQALRTPLFWALAGGIALYFFSSFGLVVHSVPLFESRGVGAAWAAALVSFMAGLSLLTRLLLAWLADRVHRFETVAMIVTGSGILGSLVLLFDASASTLALFVLLWALADSGTSLIEPLALTRAFGVRHFATILGAVNVLRTVCMLMSPVLAGAIFDATDSYNGALLMFVGTFGVSLCLFYLATRLPRPVGHENSIGPHSDRQAEQGPHEPTLRP